MNDKSVNLSGKLSVKELFPSPILFNSWYRFTVSPEKLQRGTSFEQREAARKARLTSVVLLFLIVALLILLPIGLFNHSFIMSIGLCGGLIVVCVALFCNRQGWSNLAGFLVTSFVFLSVVVSILSSPGGLSTTTLGLFYILVFVEVLAASLLPVNSVLLVALLNIAFVVFDLDYQQKTAEFARVMATDYYPVTSRIIVLHVFVVLVLWLWVHNAAHAIKRADSAEELAMRERRIQELQQTELQRKEALEKDIELILQTHVKIANGNFQARAPLSQDNQLWQIAYSLNNLVGRIQSYGQKETELNYVREVIAQLTSELQEAKKTRQPAQITTTRTFLDPLLQELAHLPVEKQLIQLQSATQSMKAYKPGREKPPQRAQDLPEKG